MNKDIEEIRTSFVSGVESCKDDYKKELQGVLNIFFKKLFDKYKDMDELSFSFYKEYDDQGGYYDILEHGSVTVDGINRYNENSENEDEDEDEDFEFRMVSLKQEIEDARQKCEDISAINPSDLRISSLKNLQEETEAILNKTIVDYNRSKISDKANNTKTLQKIAEEIEDLFSYLDVDIFVQVYGLNEVILTRSEMT